jgi:DNA polymerase delta subunit 1
METGFGFGRYPTKIYPTFESNLPIVLRFMVDSKMTGMNWIELPAGKYVVRSEDVKTSCCQYEVDILMSDCISHAPDDDWSEIAPLRILSFDIECAGRKGAFPEASQDPVIQIASVVTVQGEKQPRIRTVFSFRSCASIVGATVMGFDREEDMLMAWVEFFKEVDPDIVIGYNICNFDFGYLIDRAQALKLAKFPFLGRLDNVLTKASDSFFSSKAYGTREGKTYSMRWLSSLIYYRSRWSNNL